jgi:glycerophosphoryl diester phosphodiesterase
MSKSTSGATLIVMKIIGHRGARGLVPENTLVALRKALEHHVDAIEFDLRVTKDGVPILHHDPMITDGDGKQLVIKEHDHEELKRHKPDLATFAEVLKEFDQKTSLIIEVKPAEPIASIVSLMEKELKGGRPKDSLRLASFSQETLLKLQQALPEVPMIVIERWSGVRAHRRMRQLGAHEVFMNQRWLWWGFIIGFKHSKTRLYAYTLNDPKKAKRWAKWGLAGVVTDYPDRFEK